MKRSCFGRLLFLLSPDEAGGGGGAAAPGLSVTGDAELDSAVMSRLGVELEGPAAKPEAEGRKAEGGPAAAETPEAKAARAAQEAAAAEAAKGEDGKTPEEIAAEERETVINTRIEETGQTREEVEAALVAEEEAVAAAVQTPELTPEVQTWHEAQMAAKDEELTTLRTQAEEAAAKVTELEGQLSAAGTQPLAIAPIDPLFLIDDPAQLDAEATKLRNFEAWALKNWDGIDPVEASADGNVKAQPGFTAEQIRERYTQVKELREQVLPAARQGIQARKAHEAQGRKAYPELFDPKRPEFKVAENLLKLAPGLKAVVPNIHIVIGDALRGEKLRLAEEKARAAKGKAAAGKTATPPKVVKPGGGTPNAQRSTANAPGKKTDKVLDTEKFTKAMEAGGTGRAALVAALS